MPSIDAAKVIAVRIDGRWMLGVTEFQVDGDQAQFVVNWRNREPRRYVVALSEITGYEQST